MTHLAYRCYFKAGKIIKEEKHSEVWIGSTPTLLIFTTSNVISFFSHSLHMFVNPIYISYIANSFIYCRQKLHKGALPQPQHLALNLQCLHERALQRDVHSNRGGTRTSHEELWSFWFSLFSAAPQPWFFPTSLRLPQQTDQSFICIAVTAPRGCCRLPSLLREASSPGWNQNLFVKFISMAGLTALAPVHF